MFHSHESQLFYVSAECMTYLRLTSHSDNVTYSHKLHIYSFHGQGFLRIRSLFGARGHVCTYDIMMLNTEQPTVAASLLKRYTL